MRHSKALAEAGYDPDARVLRLRFRNGGLYDYRDVPPEVFVGLMSSDHPWTDWQARIRDVYDATRLDG